MGWFKNIADATISGAKAVGSGIASATKVVAEKVEQTYDAAQAAAKTTANAAANAAKATANAAKVTVNATANAGKAAGNAVVSGSKYVANKGVQTLGIAKDVATGIAYATALTAIATGVAAAAVTLRVIDKVEETYEAAKDVAKATATAVGNAGIATGNAVASASKATANAVTNASKATANALVNAGKATGNAVASGAGYVANKGAQAIGVAKDVAEAAAVVTAIAAVATTMAGVMATKYVVDKVVDTYDAAKEAAKAAATATAKAAMAAARAVEQKAIEAAKATKRAAQAAEKKAEEAAEKVADAAAAAGKAVKQKVVETYVVAKEVGSALKNFATVTCPMALKVVAENVIGTVVAGAGIGFGLMGAVPVQAGLILLSSAPWIKNWGQKIVDPSYEGKFLSCPNCNTDQACGLDSKKPYDAPTSEPVGKRPPGCSSSNLKKVYFINGINNVPSQNCSTSKAIAKATCTEVISVYNRHEGMGGDIIECMSNMLMMKKVKPTKALVKLLDNHFGDPPTKPYKPFNLHAHSQGGLISRQALKNYKEKLKLNLDDNEIEELMGNIEVKSFGTAANGWPSGPKYEQFRNIFDPIPWVIELASLHAFNFSFSKDTKKADTSNRHYSFTTHLGPIETHSMNADEPKPKNSDEIGKHKINKKPKKRYVDMLKEHTDMSKIEKCISCSNI